jgi:deoxyribose-phosphate aldolase
MLLTLADFARMVDLSAVRVDTTAADVAAACSAARAYRCAAVSVLPCYTDEASALLGNEPDVRLDGNVGFPAGADLTGCKVMQARELVRLGCGELDMVMNVGWLRSGRDRAALDDVRAVVEAAGGRPVKVILEVSCLSEDEVRRACELVVAAGAAFVKTGTGWAAHPCRPEDVRLIRSVVGDRAQIKAAGGIRDIPTVVALYGAGARRFGLGYRSGLALFEEWAARPEQAVEVED